MVVERTLKNIHIQDFYEFFKKHEVPRRSIRIQAGSTPVKYTKILEIIEQELVPNDGSFTNEDLDDFLFEQLYYNNNDHHYLYNLNDLFLTDELMDKDGIINHFSSNPSLKYNQSLSDWEDNTDTINLCTSRLEFNENNELEKIHLLLRIGVIAGENGRTNVFCGVVICVSANTVILKFRQGHIQEMNESQIIINKSIISSLSGEGKDGVQFRDLGLYITTLNENSVEAMIYKLFAELSKEAENKLNSELDDSVESKIEDFLEKGLNIVKSEENFEDYIEQIKAVVFQDISSRMTHTLFKKGWVFKFVFREGDHSRASSNAEKRSPVYSYKSFWQLKELIHSLGELQEAGFHWNLNEVESDSKFVDVRFESRSGTMLMHYYYKTRSGRKEKEEYVIQKITGNL
ncbi:hypothetical protein BK143_09320 [Paenibacillus peoriae]|uniref:hypothetical protein n=1 Tax=Paenibacillus peoriae TaxID=59893 RepID=UPI00096ECA63|nr:hypothetical protein [Paenibacillus peoriae]OMF72460.1 hypothetical protein BK143_09320 [Paenibacillus peoriae]